MDKELSTKEELQRIADTLERIEMKLSQIERKVGREEVHHPSYQSWA